MVEDDGKISVGATREEPRAATGSSSGPGINEEAIKKIKELAEMKAQNIITEEEFQLMKKRILK